VLYFRQAKAAATLRASGCVVTTFTGGHDMTDDTTVPTTQQETPDWAERFWTKVDRRGPDDCWEWTGCVSQRAGYGQFHLNRKTQLAHRIAYALTHGAIPEGVFVCHHCDNRMCCNPDHLFLGTQIDNMRDCIAKDRFPSGNRNGMHLHPEAAIQGDEHWTRTRPQDVPRGENSWSYLHSERMARGEQNHFSKLSEADIREIRRLYATRTLLQREIAAMFGVQANLVSRIVRHKIWRHVS